MDEVIVELREVRTPPGPNISRYLSYRASVFASPEIRKQPSVHPVLFPPKSKDNSPLIHVLQSDDDPMNDDPMNPKSMHPKP